MTFDWKKLREKLHKFDPEILRKNLSFQYKDTRSFV